MLTDLCQYLRNWFDRERYFGEFTIEEGVLSASFLQNGQYYRIIGSVFNDGVHKFGEPSDALTDETFNGSVWALAIPPAVLDLNDEIDSWVEQYSTVQNSPYSSESFGGYSYTKGTSSGSGGDKSTWQGVFAPRLNRYRKL